MSEIGTICIFGGASQKLLKTLTIDLGTVFDQDDILMNYLIQAGIPIASSCSGDGVCRKCVVVLNQKLVLSCQVKMADLFTKSLSISVQVAYL